MSRLIDAERLKRTFAACVPPVAQDYVKGFCAIVDSVSTVDAVEVVRCRDCRYYEIMQLKRDGTDDRRYKPSLCVLHNRNFDEDYYCADGERREVTE